MITALQISDLRKARYSSFLLAALLILALTLWSAVTLAPDAPYLGIEVTSDGRIHEIDPEGPAYRAGLRVGDLIAALDGRSIYAGTSLYAGKLSGSAVDVQVQRGGALLTVRVRLERISQHEFAITLERLFIGLIFWVVGTAVWMLRPGDRHVRLFFIMSQVIAAIMASETLDPVVPSAVVISDVLRVMMAPVVLHFYASFPVPLPPRVRQPLLQLTYGGFLLLALALSANLLLPFDVAAGQVWTFARTFDALVLLSAMAILLRPQGDVSMDSRRRRRALIAGMALGVSPTLLLKLVPALPFVLGQPLLGYVWTIPFIGFVPIVYAYAVYKGELGHVDFLLNRTVVYLLLTTLLLVTYVFLFLALDRMLTAGQEWDYLISGAVLVVAASAMFVPLRERLQRWVDRIFYGGWYDYRSFVQGISSDLSRVQDRDQLLQQLEGAAQTMRYRAGAVLWPDGEAFVAAGSFGFREDELAGVRLPKGGSVALYLARSAQPVTAENLSSVVSGLALTDGEDHVLSMPGVHLWIPLVARGALQAVVLTSRHVGDEPTGPEDLAILMTLSRQAAIACENVALLESLRERLAQVERMRDEISETQKQLAEGREAERAHLARELHDGPVQDLYALNHALEVLASGVNEEANEHLRRMHESIQAVAATLRDVCTELRPPFLSEFGLDTAIRSYAARFQEKHPQIGLTLDLMPGASVLSEPVQLALFRICQEALHNAGQHAGASRIWIRFEFDAEQSMLVIRDDGNGFAVPERWIELGRRGHLGLLGIWERAKAIDGDLEVDSGPGRGTTVRVSAPRSGLERDLEAARRTALT